MLHGSQDIDMLSATWMCKLVHIIGMFRSKFPRPNLDRMNMTERRSSQTPIFLFNQLVYISMGDTQKKEN